jgi:tetratricopeptide (TPR) repeat protein
MPGTTARKSDPAKEEAFVAALYRGGELLAAGKVVDAREHLEKAHELDPKNEKAQNLLGLTYFKLGLFEQASHIYELLVNENPADPTLRVNLGLVYLKSNHLERAIKEFETATDLDAGHKKAHNYLGLALAQAGDYGKARDHFTLAGSDQMADKMDRALSNRAASLPSNPGLPPPPSSPSAMVAEEPPAPTPSYPGQVLAVAVSTPLPPPRESSLTPPPQKTSCASPKTKGQPQR